MVPEAVLAAFGVAGSVPALLPGGQGGTWRAGQVVLKRADSPRSARWTAEIYSTLSGPGFRVPRPVRSAAEDWVAHGWVAWQWLPGATANWRGVSPQWPRLVAASRGFHAALAGVPAPPWLGRDGSPWAVADQVAWGERDPEVFTAAAGESLGAQLGRLFAALRPVDLPVQIVHGDLAGNVLFADGSPPAVIDFSPYSRPAGLAIAVAAVDVLLWSGAHPSIAAVGTHVTEMAEAGTRGQEDGDAQSQHAPFGTKNNEQVLAQSAVGYTRATRRLARLGDERTVFVKAAGTPGCRSDITNELAAYEAIGPMPFMPRLIAAARSPVPLVVLDALPADGWVTRWTPEAIADTEDLLARVHAVKAPARLPRWADPGAARPLSWQAIARHPARLLRMQVCDSEWLSAHIAVLTAAAAQAGLAGERLVHGDVCAANLCYRGRELVLADWATAAAGDPWFDYHDWLVALAAEGGPAPDERQGPGAAGHAALIAADQVRLTPSRDSDPVLFRRRRQRTAVALAWAARLLGLPPP